MRGVRRTWPWLVAVFLGSAMLVLSFLVPLLFPPEQAWPPEKAAEYKQVGLRLHALTHQVGGAGRNPATRDDDLRKLPAMREEYQQTKRRWEELRDELEVAQQHGQSARSVLRWFGAGLAVVGLIGWLAMPKGP